MRTVIDPDSFTAATLNNNILNSEYCYCHLFPLVGITDPAIQAGLEAHETLSQKLAQRLILFAFGGALPTTIGTTVTILKNIVVISDFAGIAEEVATEMSEAIEQNYGDLWDAAEPIPDWNDSIIVDESADDNAVVNNEDPSTTTDNDQENDQQRQRIRLWRFGRFLVVGVSICVVAFMVQQKTKTFQSETSSQAINQKPLIRESVQQGIKAVYKAEKTARLIKIPAEFLN